MFLKAYKEGVQKVFGTLDLFVSLLETEIKYPILQGGILPFWTPSFSVETVTVVKYASPIPMPPASVRPPSAHRTSFCTIAYLPYR